MKTNFLALLLIAIFTTTLSQAQTIHIKGSTREKFTYDPIPYVSIWVMDKDSTVLGKGVSGSDKGANPTQFDIERVPSRESYIVKLSCLGYETTYVPLVIKKKKETFVDMGNVLMKQATKTLSDVMVKATKIKMVVKNDTIVYNADAFQLSEGSMLDNLVKQLPGVELDSRGQITVNGRFVSSLLVNGKDFFKGDPNVALENLPAYMVGKVKVYEKEQGDAYLKKKDDWDKELVMDVNLKRQYSVGFIANAEGGYGTENRYFGRLFGLRFTKHSRLAFFANINNLNQNQKPGTSGNWGTQWTPTGLTNLKMGGLDLLIDEKKGEYNLNSNLYVQSEDMDYRTLTSGVSFLTNNNRYTFGRYNSLNKKFSLTSSHELIVKKPGLWSKHTASVGYYRWNNDYLTQRAEFDKKPTESYRGEVLDSLFSPGRYVSPASALINSYQEKGLDKGDRYNATLYSYTSWGNLKFVANGQYNKSATKQYSQYGLSLGQDETDFRNRYSNIPTERYNYDVTAQYGIDDLFGVEGLSPVLAYTFSDSYASGDRTLYRLDKYKEWNSFDGYPLGVLPSNKDSLLQAMDWQNSYFSTERTLTHTPTLSFDFMLPNDAYLLVGLPLNIAHDKLSYRRAELDTVARRSKTLFTPKIGYYYQKSGKKSKDRIEIEYKFTPSAPQLISMLDIRDDYNPLLIQLGNPDLHNEKRHRIGFHFSRNSQEKQRTLGVNLDWEARLDAIGQSMIYNEESGVRTYIPRNINGNWNIGGNFNYGQAIDKNKRWQLSTITDVRYINSVDWVSTTYSDNSIRSSVKNLSLSETLKADYRINELHIGAKVGGRWTYATSERDNFTTINSADMNYGMTAVVPLLWKIKLSTDLTLYSRRGYSNSTMNRDEVVWNATFSRSFLHGNLTCSVDGFDILGQLSNIRQAVNVQGRTETWYNSLPRYYMLRAIYRLNVQPKKK